MNALRLAIIPLALVLFVAAQRSTKPSAQPITVYRTATCGCCGKWVDHLKAAGFAPTVHVVNNIETAPPRSRVPAAVRTCHTATLDGYVVEGHVPADVIKKLLQEKPRVEGIGVPGMPAGSPGMESPNPQPYDVVAFDAKGKTTVFASVGAKR
jgi:hypothetical protein